VTEPLLRELDRWRAANRCATLWWRDDDACTDTPALRHLLGLAHDYAVYVALAAIPAGTDATLVAAVDACPEATIVQHGYAHRNHAAPGERSAELAAHRDASSMQGELEAGRGRLVAMFGERFVPILVPPWNRMTSELAPHLPRLGFAGLSRFGPRASREAAANLPQVNTHVDPIAWRRERRFIGLASMVSRVVEHLAARRTGACDADEATGVLTHHLAFGDDAWLGVRALLDATACHPAVRWLSAPAAFAAPCVTPARCA
jgi:hypothetical protein